MAEQTTVSVEHVQTVARRLIYEPNKYSLQYQDLNIAVQLEIAQLLKSINGKLTFFTVLIILGLLVSLAQGCGLLR